MSQFDYLVIGHVTHDLTEDGIMVGGTVAYAALTAQALGCRTAAVTSAGPDFDVAAALPGVAVHNVPAAATTTFTNVYDGGIRTQMIHATADRLSTEHVPEAWRATSIVHLGPVAGEVDLALAENISAGLLGLTPQGWLRDWNEDGHVFASNWPEAPSTLPLAAAVFLGEEDLPDEETVPAYRRWARLLVLTHGAHGCTVYFGDEERRFRAPAVRQVDPTGAGDIFAAAYLVRLYQTRGNPWDAAAFANRVASRTVTVSGLQPKMDQVKQALQG